MEPFKLIFLLILTAKISFSSINIVVSYTYGETAADKSAGRIITSFEEKYPNAIIRVANTHEDLKEFLKLTADTLIFYFVGHSQQNNLDTINPAAFRMLLHLRYHEKKIKEITGNYREMQNIVFTGDLLGYIFYNKSKLKVLFFDTCHAEQIYWSKFKNTFWVFSTTKDNEAMFVKNIGNPFTDMIAENISKFDSTDEFVHNINKELEEKKYYKNLDAQWFKTEYSFPIKAVNYGTFYF